MAQPIIQRGQFTCARHDVHLRRHVIECDRVLNFGLALLAMRLAKCLETGGRLPPEFLFTSASDRRPCADQA